jgi:pimeloyl-ACP methyl ester carboxylesterase
MLRIRRFATMTLALSTSLVASCLLAADGPASRTFDAKGVKLQYIIAGKGEPVVLIHGLFSSAEINWRLPGTFGELAKDHMVIALDLPGHGRSARPEDEKAYGLQVVEDVVLLLDHLKIKKAHIVGYSAGGMIALKFLARHPDRAISGTIGGMGWLREGSRLQDFWEKVPAREGQRTPAAFLRGMAKFALSRQDLEKIAVPVKILVGDLDPSKLMYVAPLRQVRPDWPIVEIANAGHIICVAMPQFRKEILAWIEARKLRVPGG